MVGSPQEKSMKSLEERVKTLSSLMSTVMTNMQKFSESMGRIAELASRLGFMLAMMGGLPRSMGHGNLAMLMFSGLGKSRFARNRGPGGGMTPEQLRVLGMSAPPGVTPFNKPVIASSIPYAQVAPEVYHQKQAQEKIPSVESEIVEKTSTKSLAPMRVKHIMDASKALQKHLTGLLGQLGDVVGGSSGSLVSGGQIDVQGALSHLKKTAKFLYLISKQKDLTPQLGSLSDGDIFLAMSSLGHVVKVFKGLSKGGKIDSGGDLQESLAYATKLLRQLSKIDQVPGSSVPHDQSELDKKHATTGLSEEEVKKKEAEDLKKLGINKATPAAGGPLMLAMWIAKYPKVFQNAEKAVKSYLLTFNKDFGAKFLGMDPEDFKGLGRLQKTGAMITEGARRAAGTFITTSSAAGAALQSGAPDAFGTLKGSVALVAAQFGQMLIPAAVDLSKGLQNVAKWFEELSPTVKDSISSIVKWTLIVTAGVTILGKLVPVVKLLTGAISLLYSSIMAGGWKQVVANISLLGAAAGAAYLALNFFASSAAKANEANRERLRTEVDEAAKKASERVPQEAAIKMNYSKQVKEELGLKESATMQEVDDFIKSKFDFSIGRLNILKQDKLYDSGRYNRLARESQAEAEKEYGTSDFSRGLQSLTEAGREGVKMFQNRIADYSIKSSSHLQEANEIQRLIDMLQGKQPIEKIKASDLTENQKALLEKRQSNSQQMMFSLSGLKATPQYNTIEELYKKINVAAMGQDSLDREMLRIQYKSQELFLEKMLKDEANSEETKGLLSEMLRALRDSGIFK